MSAFFLGTKIGRTLAALILMAIAGGLTFWFVSDTYFDKGAASVQAKWDKAKVDAATAAREDKAKKDAAASDIAADTAERNQRDTAAAIDAGSKTNEVIRYVYRDPPATAPVNPLGCAHPLDPRVQRDIEQRVAETRSAAR